VKSEIVTWFSNEGPCYQARWKDRDGLGREVYREGPMRSSFTEAERDVPQPSWTFEVMSLDAQRRHPGYDEP